MANMVSLDETESPTQENSKKSNGSMNIRKVCQRESDVIKGTMKEETRQKIRDALRELDEATNVQGLSVFALIMPHGERGHMQVQILSKGSEAQVAHKLYECMRFSDALPFDLRNIIMTAAAKWLGEQPDEARQAFDRTTEKARKLWTVQEVIADCREVIEELNDSDLPSEAEPSTPGP